MHTQCKLHFKESQTKSQIGCFAPDLNELFKKKVNGSCEKSCQSNPPQSKTKIFLYHYSNKHTHTMHDNLDKTKKNIVSKNFKYIPINY